MTRFQKLAFALLLAFAAVPCRASLIRAFDLTTLCYMSTDVVEAALARHHSAGQEEWQDTFTATVTNSLEGRYHTGDRIKGLELTLYHPAHTGQRCILFTARGSTPPQTITFREMLLVDGRDRVRRYFQFANPGALLAEGYSVSSPSTSSEEPLTNDRAEQKYPTLAEERALIQTKWTAAKKLKVPPYQVLKPTER